MLVRATGGIRLFNGDQEAGVLGRLIAYNDWSLARTFFNPTSWPILVRRSLDRTQPPGLPGSGRCWGLGRHRVDEPVT